jgi:hypothetical protein
MSFPVWIFVLFVCGLGCCSSPGLVPMERHLPPDCNKWHDKFVQTEKIRIPQFSTAMKCGAGEANRGQITLSIPTWNDGGEKSPVP